tara:strand:- start:285 stop:1112 length:828 start_codon:yes stop_codon:yes gene_type:complete
MKRKRACLESVAPDKPKLTRTFVEDACKVARSLQNRKLWLMDLVKHALYEMHTTSECDAFLRCWMHKYFKPAVKRLSVSSIPPSYVLKANDPLKDWKDDEHDHTVHNPVGDWLQRLPNHVSQRVLDAALFVVAGNVALGEQWSCQCIGEEHEDYEDYIDALHSRRLYSKVGVFKPLQSLENLSAPWCELEMLVLTTADACARTEHAAVSRTLRNWLRTVFSSNKVKTIYGTPDEFQRHLFADELEDGELCPCRACRRERSNMSTSLLTRLLKRAV